GGRRSLGSAAGRLSRGLVSASGTSLVLNAGTLYTGSGGSITNAGTIDSQGDDCICPNATVIPLSNTGTLKKSGGAGTTRIAAALDNDGAVQANSGTLEVSGGASGSTGSWTTAAGTVLLFDGSPTTFSGPVSFGGAGVTRFGVQAVMTFNGSVSFDTPVVLAGGTLGGSGAV